MKYSIWISLALYFIYGALLGAAGIGITEEPLTFIILMLLVIVIEQVGRWDEIGRRYRG